MKNIEILVVDDSPESLRLLTDLLRSSSYDVRPTTNPKLALASAQNSPPDLALLDITMPGMDGFELCRRLKKDQRTASVPVIFISALHEVTDLVHGFDAGGVDYITKPIEKQIVLARVGTHVRLAQAKRELELTNTELAIAKDKAEAANRAKSLFLANMSHELRTPLTAILGFAEVLGWNAMPEQLEDIDIINRSGEHLLSMINDVLELSKIEAGRLELKPKAFNLRVMLEDIGKMFSARAASAELNFNLELDPKLTTAVKADMSKLRQVIINLLSNAIKFTSSGYVDLRARTTPIGDDPKLVSLEIEVEDSGSGIDQKHLLHIFEPFFQVKQTPLAIKGTGLGLSISKSLVELMSGKITVESQPDQGSTFRVTVPIAVAQSDEITSNGVYLPKVSGVEPGQPAWRILVVDDDPLTRRLMRSMLDQFSFQLKEAENGMEAVEIYKKWQPELILMDLRMPEMDGYEATRKIRSLPGGNKVKIVAVTASVFAGQNKSITEIGCNDLLYKPFRSHEVYEILSRELGVRFIFEKDTAETAVES